MNTKYDPTFKNIFVVIEACRQSEHQPNKICRDPRSIDWFIKKHAIYVHSQNTIVNINKYEHNADKRFTDDQGYWPLVAESENLLWTPIVSQVEGYIPVLEVQIGVDKIEIDDSIIGNSFMKREKHFVNIREYRMTQMTEFLFPG